MIQVPMVSAWQTSKAVEKTSTTRRYSKIDKAGQTLSSLCDEMAHSLIGRRKGGSKRLDGRRELLIDKVI